MKDVPEQNIPDFSADELLPFLKDVTIFAGLPEAGLRFVIGECETEEYAAGDVLIKEGTPANDIFVILRGHVRIVLDLDRQAVDICEFGPGDCIGEASVIGVTDHSASALALDKVVVLALTRGTLMDIFRQDKEFFALLILNLARELARRLHKTDQMLLRFARGEEKL